MVIAPELPANDGITMSFYPQNEGEISYYVFELPLVNFDILTTYTILIVFPFDYDFIVGTENMEISSKALEGALHYVVRPRFISITGFYEQLGFTGMLDITLFGVINPNRINNDPTGTFIFGVLDVDHATLLQGSISIPGIVP